MSIIAQPQKLVHSQEILYNHSCSEFKVGWSDILQSELRSYYLSVFRRYHEKTLLNIAGKWLLTVILHFASRRLKNTDAEGHAFSCQCQFVWEPYCVMLSWLHKSLAKAATYLLYSALTKNINLVIHYTAIIIYRGMLQIISVISSMFFSLYLVPTYNILILDLWGVGFGVVYGSGRSVHISELSTWHTQLHHT